MCKALFASIQSALASLLERLLSKLADGITILFKDKSSATASAIAMYEQVSSSPKQEPGAIHGTLTMKANTISADLRRRFITSFANDLLCFDNLLHKAAADGINNAAVAMIEVKRKADCERTNSTVWTDGSRPHLVCARFW
jgi:hypothetical protein